MRGAAGRLPWRPYHFDVIELMKRVTPFAVDPEPLATQLSQNQPTRF
jgi:hypothetical protein